MYVINSFDNAFLCATYIPSTELQEEVLLLGDDKGILTKLTLSTLDLSHKLATTVKKSGKSNITVITISSKKLIV